MNGAKRPSKDVPVPALPVFSNGALSPVFRNTRRSSSALGTVPATALFRGEQEDAVPPPSLSSDDFGDLVGLVNQVYSVSEKQKTDAELRAKQYEDRQGQLTTLMKQLAESNRQELKERERTAFDATLESERSQRERLGNKCHQLAAELVSSVRKNEELELKLTQTESHLGNKDAEIAARAVETTRMEHEIVGLRTAIDRDKQHADDAVLSHPNVMQLRNRVKQLETVLHATTTVNNNNNKSFAGMITPARTPLPAPAAVVPHVTAQPATLVKAKAIIVDAPFSREPSPQGEELLRMRVVELEAQREQEAGAKVKLMIELQAAKDRLAELVVRESKREGQAETITMYAGPRRTPAEQSVVLSTKVATIATALSRPSPTRSRTPVAVLDPDKLAHDHAADLAFGECIARSDLMIQQIMEWKVRCVQVSRHLIVSADNEAKQKRVHGQAIVMLEEQCTELQSEIDALCRERESSEEREEYREIIRKLEYQLRETEEQAQHAEVKRVESSDGLAELSLDMEQMRATYEARESLLNQKIAELEADNYDMECAKEIAETTCEEARQRIAALESSRDAWWQECSSILRQMADRRRETAASMQELDTLRREVEELRIRNAELEEMQTGVERQPSAERQSSFNQLQAELEAERCEKGRLEDMLQNAFTESTAAVQALELNLQEAQKTIISQREELGKLNTPSQQSEVTPKVKKVRKARAAVPAVSAGSATPATPDTAAKAKNSKYTKEGRKPGVPVFRRKEDFPHDISKPDPPLEAREQAQQLREHSQSQPQTPQAHRVLQTPPDVPVANDLPPVAEQQVFEVMGRKHRQSEQSRPSNSGTAGRVSMAQSVLDKRDESPLSEWQGSAIEVTTRMTASAKSRPSTTPVQRGPSPMQHGPSPKQVRMTRDVTPAAPAVKEPSPMKEPQGRMSFGVVLDRSQSKSPEHKEGWEATESEPSPRGTSHFIGKDDMLWDDVLESGSHKSSEELARLLDGEATPRAGQGTSPLAQVVTPIKAVNINLRVKENDPSPQESTGSEKAKLVAAVEDQVSEMLEHLQMREESVRHREEKLLDLQSSIGQMGKERKVLQQREVSLEQKERVLQEEKSASAERAYQQQRELVTQQKKIQHQQEVLQQQLQDVISTKSSPAPPLSSGPPAPQVPEPLQVLPLVEQMPPPPEVFLEQLENSDEASQVLRSFLQHNSTVSSRELKKLIQAELERANYVGDQGGVPRASHSPHTLTTPERSVGVADLIQQLQQLTASRPPPRRRRRRSPVSSSSSSSSDSASYSDSSDSSDTAYTSSRTDPVEARPPRRKAKKAPKKPFKF